MTPLSQRDPKWKDIQLGFSDLTISSHGCTITGIAMILGTTPDVVNAKLKAVKGFQGALVIWSKLLEAFPQITRVERVFSYNNDEVSKNLPCLVEVNGARIGASKHWVVFTGSGLMNDPWFGTTKPTSYYPPTGYTIIQLKPSTMPDSDCQKQLTLIKQENENLRRINDENLDRIIDARRERDDNAQKITTLEDQIKTSRAEYKVTIDQLTTEAKVQKDNFHDFKRRLAEIYGTSQDEAMIISTASTSVSYEDLYTKELANHTATKDQLNQKTAVIDSLNREIESLKEELRVAKGLKDAKAIELITELIHRLLNIKKETK